MPPHLRAVLSRCDHGAQGRPSYVLAVLLASAGWEANQPLRFGTRVQGLGTVTMNIFCNIVLSHHLELSRAHQRNAGCTGVLHAVVGLVLMKLCLVKVG